MASSPSNTMNEHSPPQIANTPSPSSRPAPLSSDENNNNNRVGTANTNNSNQSTSQRNVHQFEDIPAEMFNSVRSLQRTADGGKNNSTTKLSSSRRKNKLMLPNPQAHPEPRGADEAEVRMMWNRIAPLQGGNKMTTPNEPPTLYTATSNHILGGPRDHPSFAALTQPFVETPKDLLALTRGPIEVFMALTGNGQPKVGWMMPHLRVDVPTSGEVNNNNNNNATTSTKDNNAASQNNNNNNPNQPYLGPPMPPLAIQPHSYNGELAVVAGYTTTCKTEGDGDYTNNNQMSNSNNNNLLSASMRHALDEHHHLYDLIQNSQQQQQNNQAQNYSQRHSSVIATTLQAPRTGNNNHNSNFYPSSSVTSLLQQVAVTTDSEISETIMLEKHLEECTQWMTDLATAVQNERHLFAEWKSDLVEEITELEKHQYKKKDDYRIEREEKQLVQRAELHLRENDLERLYGGEDRARRNKVLGWLSEKKRILRELKETSIAVETAERSSTDKIMSVEAELQKQREKLEKTLKGKLANAVEQMSQLSEAQRKARESSTVEDFNRLVKELTEQERKMRELNSSSGKLQSRIGALRREISLEAQRGQILQEKQESYHANISTLVHRLEDIERKYAAQSQRELKGIAASAGSGETKPSKKTDGLDNDDGSNNNNNGSGGDAIDLNELMTKHHNKNTTATLGYDLVAIQNQQLKQLPRIIDQQYAVILQLRADLIRVRREVAQATQLLQAERIAVVASANPSIQPVLSRVAKKQAQYCYGDDDDDDDDDFKNQEEVDESRLIDENNNQVLLLMPHPPSSSNKKNNSTSPIASIETLMRSSEMNYIKNIVYDALADADQNLVSVVANANANKSKGIPTSSSTMNNNNNNNNNNNGSLLAPVYPVLELLDPTQRRDVFEFVVRRINSKLLNPLMTTATEKRGVVW